MLSVFFGAEGYLVDTAAGGEEALRRIRSFEPDLVVTDLEMPGMNGLQFIRALRSQQPGCPVLLVTAREDDRSTLEELGRFAGFRCLYKPLDLEALASEAYRLTKPVSAVATDIAAH